MLPEDVPREGAMNVVLISTYELGRQPFSISSPAVWLRQAGCEVTCLDLAVQRLSEHIFALATARLNRILSPYAYSDEARSWPRRQD